MVLTLLKLNTGKKAKIVKLEGGSDFKTKLATLNIRCGKIIKKIALHPFKGPLVIEVDNTKATIGRGMASNIIVDEYTDDD
jgi:ferrous iron transport protein A